MESCVSLVKTFTQISELPDHPSCKDDMELFRKPVYSHFSTYLYQFCRPFSLVNPRLCVERNIGNKNQGGINMNYEREISNQLRRLGVNNSYVGFRYTIYGVARTIHDPTLLAYISKGLYVDIAVHYQTSVGCVERNIRTLINTIWLHGDKKLLNEIFNFELSQKPRNGAFIDALANYIAVRGNGEEMTGSACQQQTT